MHISNSLSMPIDSLLTDIATGLTQGGKRLVTAESCTGGLVAAALTSRPGSSGWFERGWVTYSNAAKTEELGVDAALITQQGAVSEAVAAAMAGGACAHSLGDYAIAITGIAGPDGGSVEKPVGTVCFGWANRQHCHTETMCFNGDRQSIRQQATIHALAGFLLFLNNPNHFSF
jgi:nicotinamide-nucleotide amidase